MTTVQTFKIPGLATVRLDNRTNDEPLLEIVLADDHLSDLNDIARGTSGPESVYLRCDSAEAVNSPELAKFLEVMTHWDYTGDGAPTATRSSMQSWTPSGGPRSRTSS